MVECFVPLFPENGVENWEVGHDATELECGAGVVEFVRNWFSQIVNDSDFWNWNKCSNRAFILRNASNLVQTFSL